MHYISIHWFDIRIKPILSNIFDIIVTHALFPIKEYNKGNIKDTNVIVNHLNEVKELIELSKKNNCDNTDELCNILNISDDTKEEIKLVKLIYDNYLDRRKK